MYKRYLILLMITVGLITMSGCSSSDSGTASSGSVEGLVQKGPFVKGSKVIIYKLDEKIERSSQKVEGAISDDDGHYSLNVSWSGLSEIEITGYYLNEISGEKSQKEATLISVVEVSSDGKFNTNVNLLTHFASLRMKALLKEGKSTKDAKKEVLKDLQTLFSLVFPAGVDLGVLDLTQITGDKAQINAELLRLSAALLNSGDPLGDLNALMKLYNEKGVDAVKKALAFKQWQQNRKDLDFVAAGAHLNLNVSALELVKEKLVKIILRPLTLMSFTMELYPNEYDVIPLGIPHSSSFAIVELPTHGTETHYLVGNEFWSLKYTSNATYTGHDTIIYEENGEYGEIDILIKEPQAVLSILDGTDQDADKAHVTIGVELLGTTFSDSTIIFIQQVGNLSAGGGFTYIDEHHVSIINSTEHMTQDETISWNIPMSEIEYGKELKTNTITVTQQTAPVVIPETVVMGDLMWEDTQHARDINVTWGAANQYCISLDHGGFTDWRLPQEQNSGLSELALIRLDGNDSAPGERTIVEPFLPVYQDEFMPYWTGMQTPSNLHIAAIFAYDMWNEDAFQDTEELFVRCVRDMP